MVSTLTEETWEELNMLLREGQLDEDYWPKKIVIASGEDCTGELVYEYS